MLTLSALKASDIPDPEAFGSCEVLVYSKRWGQWCESPVSKGRERSTGCIYYCLRLADGFRTYDSLAGLKAAIRR